MLKQYTCEKCGCSFEKDASATAICTICGTRRVAATDVKIECDQAKTSIFAMMSYGGSCKKRDYTNGRLHTLEWLVQSYLAACLERAPDATLAEGRRDNGPKRPIKG